MSFLPHPKPALLAFGLAAALVFPAQPVVAQSPDDPARKPSEIMPMASRSLLLDVVAVGDTVYATGERGTVLRSNDRGSTWAQLEVPTRLALTAVAAVGDRVWVAGHSGQILSSADGGTTWTRQRLDVWTPDAFALNAGAPIFDLLFVDASTGYAVGAFSTLLRTRDGGATWQALALKKEAEPAADDLSAAADANAADEIAAEGSTNSDWVFSDDELTLDQETDPHLNAIVQTPDGALYVAGERGAMFRSSDAGERWDRLDFPYDGSMFGLMALGEGHVLAYGLRGNVFETTDAGQTWARLETGTEATLQGGSALPQGGALIVGNEGVLLRRDSGAQPLQLELYTTDDGKTPVLSGAMRIDNHVLVIGEEGVGHHGR